MYIQTVWYDTVNCEKSSIIFKRRSSMTMNFWKLTSNYCIRLLSYCLQYRLPKEVEE
jgi:hypothetical protein